MQEDEIAKIRISPKVLSEIISSLSQEQQTWVRNAGFGSLLYFNLGGLPQRLAFKVLQAFDDASCMLKIQNGNIKITEREIYHILGLPYEGDEVVIAQGDSRHERIFQWRAQFPVSDGQSLIKASEVVDRMKQGRNADELFKMNFLIIITNVLIRSNTNNFVSQMILSFDDELDNCAQYNWAAYLIKNLVITKERWMRTTSLFYSGPMIFLVVSIGWSVLLIFTLQLMYQEFKLIIIKITTNCLTNHIYRYCTLIVSCTKDKNLFVEISQLLEDGQKKSWEKGKQLNQNQVLLANAKNMHKKK